MNMSEPSKAALTEERVHIGNISTLQYLAVGEVFLSLDAEDAPEA